MQTANSQQATQQQALTFAQLQQLQQLLVQLQSSVTHKFNEDYLDNTIGSVTLIVDGEMQEHEVEYTAYYRQPAV